MSADKPAQTQLRVGRLTKAHGLKGAIKLELYTDDPEQRFVPGAVFTLQVPTGSKWHGKTLELTELRWYNGHAVGFFKGVDDRSEAETLVKAILWVNQDPAELPEEEDAWYDHQLVGLDALRDGVKVGHRRPGRPPARAGPARDQDGLGRGARPVRQGDRAGGRPGGGNRHAHAADGAVRRTAR